MNRSPAIRDALERLNTSKYRLWIVTIPTLIVGLTIALPTADDYRASLEKTRRTMSDIRQAKADIQHLDESETLRQLRGAELTLLEMRTTGEPELQAFRERVVELARDAGCRVRTVRVSPPVSRPWKSGDPVLNPTVTGRAAKGPFNLTSQSIQVSLAGNLSGLSSVLEQLRADRRLLHAQNIQLKPAGQAEAEQLILDLDLLLFDLTERTDSAA